MRLQLTAPSKTFLLGEYIALQGGPTLVLASQPCFNLTVNYSQAAKPVIFEKIAQVSPAGKFLLQHAEAFKGCHLIFHDPHNGLGGFGASSAQFLLVAVLKKILREFSINITCQTHELLAEYLKYAWEGIGMMPSGADLIAQAQGGISYFYKTQNRLQTLAWPFKHINYYLLHTGNKVATHQHLKELTFLTNHQLIDIVFAGLQHLQTKHAAGFVDCVNQYAQALQSLGLVLASTSDLLKIINARPEVLAAKGCGALGADVILVLVEAKHHQSFLDWLTKQKLNLVAFGNQAERGLRLTTEVTIIL